jgi:hypothetical protein
MVCRASLQLSLPIDVRRVPSTQTAQEVGAEQIQALAEARSACIEQNTENYPPEVNAAIQLSDPQSVLSTFKAIASLRNASPALQSLEPVDHSYGRITTSDDENSFSYLRYLTETKQAILVATNLLGQARAYTPQPGRSQRVMDRLGSRKNLIRRLGSVPFELRLNDKDQVEFELPAYGFAFYEAR